MNRESRFRWQMRRLCGELHADDGCDPRDLFQERSHNTRRDHKLKQLCTQVARTVDLVLAGDFHDGVLVHLHVHSVFTAPNAAQLNVSLVFDPPNDEVTIDEARRRLDAVAGRIRCEVAASINRKRAPRLVFSVIPAGQDNRGGVR